MIRHRQLPNKRMQEQSKEMMPSKRPKETTTVEVVVVTAEAVVIIEEDAVVAEVATGTIADVVVTIAETAKMKTDLSLKLVRNLSLDDTTIEDEEEIAVTTEEAAEVVEVTEVTDAEVVEATLKEDLKLPVGTRLKTTDNRCE